MEAEADKDRAFSAKQKRRRPILLSILLLLVLSGASLLVFAVVRQLRPGVPSSTNLGRDLPTTLHWQAVFQHSPFAGPVAAPSDPTTLYLCSDQSVAGEEGFTLARSTDAGAHWQVLISRLADGAGCQVAVNPANANDLSMVVFRVGVGNTIAETYSTLEQSRDGGRTWKKMTPVLILSPTNHVAWNGLGVRFAGSRLFAIQILNNAFHLIASSDGGQTWTVIDASLFSAGRELVSYAVDPSAVGTIYELVGPIMRGSFSYVPGGKPLPTPVPFSPARLAGQLYKTTDGGGTWQELLSSVPYGTRLQLASAYPHVLYLGGRVSNPSRLGTEHFQMQMSRDGGATWQTLSLPAHVSLLNDWLVDATGLFYDTAEYIDNKSRGDQELLTPVPLLGSLQRYNPATGQWSRLNLPADAALFLAITRAGARGGDILWLTNMQGLLYRGTA